MSPTTIFTPLSVRCATADGAAGQLSGGGCTRGGVAGWGPGGCTGRAIPGYYPAAILGPIFSIYLRPGPTHGQMKAKFRFLMRFPRMGLELTQN